MNSTSEYMTRDTIHQIASTFFNKSESDFLIQRLMNKHNILQQAEYRNLDVNNLWKLPNRDIVSILISYDKKGS